MKEEIGERDTGRQGQSQDLVEGRKVGENKRVQRERGEERGDKQGEQRRGHVCTDMAGYV